MDEILVVIFLTFVSGMSAVCNLKYNTVLEVVRGHVISSISGMGIFAILVVANHCMSDCVMRIYEMREVNGAEGLVILLLGCIYLIPITLFRITQQTKKVPLSSSVFV